MENFLIELQEMGRKAEELAAKIEGGENYMDALKFYLPILNQTVTKLFEIMQLQDNPIEISQDFVLQVLNDIMYGIEKEDSVCLTDVLRYGLIELFDYVAAELQGVGWHE